MTKDPNYNDLLVDNLIDAACREAVAKTQRETLEMELRSRLNDTEAAVEAAMEAGKVPNEQ